MAITFTDDVNQLSTSKTVDAYLTPLRLGNKFVSKTFYTKNIYYSIALRCIKKWGIKYFILYKLFSSSQKCFIFTKICLINN